jgi:hypothetical protein
VSTIKPAWEGEVPTEPNCSTLFWLSRSFALPKKARTIKSELLRQMTIVSL